MRNDRGFTLIELLVVISLIGILTGIAAINLIGVRGRARDAERKSDLSTIRSALELHRADLGTYRQSLPACDAPLTGGSSTYLSETPCEPQTGNPAYTYNPAPAGCLGTPASPCLTYTMTACLENPNDPDGSGACGTNGVLYTVRNP